MVDGGIPASRLYRTIFNVDVTVLRARAVRIDCMLINVALVQLTTSPEVKKNIATVAHIMETGTLVMSAGLNALASTAAPLNAAR